MQHQHEPLLPDYVREEVLVEAYLLEPVTISLPATSSARRGSLTHSPQRHHSSQHALQQRQYQHPEQHNSPHTSLASLDTREPLHNIKQLHSHHPHDVDPNLAGSAPEEVEEEDEEEEGGVTELYHTRVARISQVYKGGPIPPWLGAALVDAQTFLPLEHLRRAVDEEAASEAGGFAYGGADHASVLTSAAADVASPDVTMTLSQDMVSEESQGGGVTPHSLRGNDTGGTVNHGNEGSIPPSASPAASSFTSFFSGGVSGATGSRYGGGGNGGGAAGRSPGGAPLIDRVRESHFHVNSSRFSPGGPFSGAAATFTTAGSRSGPLTTGLQIGQSRHLQQQQPRRRRQLPQPHDSQPPHWLQPREYVDIAPPQSAGSASVGGRGSVAGIDSSSSNINASRGSGISGNWGMPRFGSLSGPGLPPPSPSVVLTDASTSNSSRSKIPPSMLTRSQGQYSRHTGATAMASSANTLGFIQSRKPPTVGTIASNVTSPSTPSSISKAANAPSSSASSPHPSQLIPSALSARGLTPLSPLATSVGLVGVNATGGGGVTSMNLADLFSDESGSDEDDDDDVDLGATSSGAGTDDEGGEIDEDDDEEAGGEDQDIGYREATSVGRTAIAASSNALVPNPPSPTLRVERVAIAPIGMYGRISTSTTAALPAIGATAGVASTIPSAGLPTVAHAAVETAPSRAVRLSSSSSSASGSKRSRRTRSSSVGSGSTASSKDSRSGVGGEAVLSSSFGSPVTKRGRRQGLEAADPAFRADLPPTEAAAVVAQGTIILSNSVLTATGDASTAAAVPIASRSTSSAVVSDISSVSAASLATSPLSHSVGASSEPRASSVAAFADDAAEADVAVHTSATAYSASSVAARESVVSEEFDYEAEGFLVLPRQPSEDAVSEGAPTSGAGGSHNAVEEGVVDGGKVDVSTSDGRGFGAPVSSSSEIVVAGEAAEAPPAPVHNAQLPLPLSSSRTAAGCVPAPGSASGSHGGGFGGTTGGGAAN